MRKSTSIDSLTSSIQWASSTTKTTGFSRANEAAFTTAVSRRRRASGSMGGKAVFGSAMPSRSSSSCTSSGSASGTRSRTRSRAVCPPRPSTPKAARQPRDGMEGDLTGMRLAECSEHLNTTRRCHGRKLAHQTALPDTRRPDDAHHRAVTIDRPVQQALHGGHLPAPTNQSRLRTPDPRMPFAHAQQAKGGHRFLGALNPNHLRFTQNRRPVHQPRGRFRQHHPTRRRHRLHPLSHPHLLTHSGVTQSDRADLTSDYLTGIEPYTQGQVDAVAIADLGSQQCTFFLDT